MNITEVIEGLKTGKKYRRSETLASGDTYTEEVYRIGNSMFRHTVSGTDAEDEWGWGGSSDLPTELLPGRFDTEGWEEYTDWHGGIIACPQCNRLAKKHEWDPVGHKGQAGQFQGVDVYACTAGCLVECEYSDKEHPCWWPFLFTHVNREGFTPNKKRHRPDGRIAVCSPHNHS